MAMNTNGERTKQVPQVPGPLAMNINIKFRNKVHKNTWYV